MADPISHVNVIAVDDELFVSWRGGSESTTVFVSTDPDDAGVDARPPDGPGRIRVFRRRERIYIHLFEPDDGFTVAAERRLEFDGPSNFRDIGGYPTMDGAATRWGTVFRSDRLDGLTDDDHRAIEQLGVATVFDLRSEEEAAYAPDRLPDRIDYVHLPMSSDTARRRSMFQRIAEGELEKYDEDDMAAGYLRMLEVFGGHLARIIETVAAGSPLLFHCSAGKDRTGITAMVLLGLAEVADPHVLDDYEVTNRYRPASADALTTKGSPFEDLVRDRGLDPADFETLWLAPRPVMRRTVDGLRERWGDHRDYVRAIGVDDDVAEAARAALRRSD